MFSESGAGVRSDDHVRKLHVRPRQREFFINNLLVRVHFIIVMIGWTGLAPWAFEFLFPCSLTSTSLNQALVTAATTMSADFTSARDKVYSQLSTAMSCLESTLLFFRHVLPSINSPVLSPCLTLD